MNYTIYKLYFTTGVHIGKKSLEDGEYTINSDTIFSALCHEAIKTDNSDCIKKLLNSARNNKIRFSDGLPFINDRLYIPKPLKPIKAEEEGNSIKKKAFKNLKYIPVNYLNEYLKGNLEPEKEADIFSSLGSYVLKTRSAIHGLKEAKPYSVGEFKFSKDNGIYICVGYNENEDLYFIEDLISGLSYTGIGGKLSSGLGKFEFSSLDIPRDMLIRLNNKKSEYYMSLSSCLPKEAELNDALQGSYYILNKRSGFVCSVTYADGNLKKKDLYTFKSGSCFTSDFMGDIYDVSYNGNHPVYRYAMPMLMGVD